MRPPFAGTPLSTATERPAYGMVPSTAGTMSTAGPLPACMYLARFYLPLQDDAGHVFPVALFRAVEAELAQRFGGVTAHLTSPAKGLWRENGTTHTDEVVVFEVLLEDADRAWWSGYRTRLERDFRQKRVLLMLQPVEVV
jgi:hypothetical protein